MARRRALSRPPQRAIRPDGHGTRVPDPRRPLRVRVPHLDTVRPCSSGRRTLGRPCDRDRLAVPPKGPFGARRCVPRCRRVACPRPGTRRARVTDDRARFEQEKREAATRMAADEELAAEALALNVAADRYDWTYQWSWLGLPVIQIPPDIVALQEVIWETRPQLVIETGIARGGSLVLYASILELIGAGEVLGIDVDIRAHNREAIEAHPLAKRIRMIEGSSLDEQVVAQ